jgi:hypothetical protein
MTPRVVILYPGGAYGTYLEWVLTSLTSDLEYTLPFNQNGNSHKFEGNRFNRDSTEDMPDVAFSRIHPKTPDGLTPLKDSIEEILEWAHKVVYLYPDHESVLLIVNNAYEKIYNDWWAARLLDPVFADNLYNNWNVNPSQHHSQIPTWIKREILSFNLMPSWFAEVEWYHPDSWSHERSHLVLIKDLLFDFESTLAGIQTFCDLTFKRDIAEFLPHHATMMSLQKHLSQNQICTKIINSVINGTYYEWSVLPLPSEAWIQWELRNHGYEIRCHGLDTFPTNSVHLKELLYPV